MSSNSRLLKKPRKVTGLAIASSSLMLCSSQVCCAQVHVVVEGNVMHITGFGKLTRDGVWQFAYNDYVHSVVINESITSGVTRNIFRTVKLNT